MMGILTWTAPAGGLAHRRVRLEERKILGARFLEASVARGPKTPEAAVRRRVLAAARRLRKAGVTRTVLPEGFAYGPELERGGLAPVSTLFLRRSLAADLARSALAARGERAGGRLAAAGDRLTGEMARAVTELALGNRYVLLDVPYGAEALAAQLRREYGVSLLLSPARELLEEADVLLLFDPRPDLKPGGSTVRLYEETAPLPPLLLPPAQESGVPAGLSRPQLLAALVEEGALRPGQIAIGTPQRGEAAGILNFLETGRPGA